MRRPLLAVAAVLVACNAISGLDEDFVLAPLDGGTSTDATIGDGATGDGSPTSDVVTSDVPTDAGPSDAFSCTSGDAANVVFCTDFETDAAWTDSELAEGTVAFELDAGFGGTRGMHAHVNDAGISRRAALWRRLTTTDAKTYVHWDVSFDFMIAGKTFPYAALGVFALTQPADGGGLRFYGPASFGDKTLDAVDDPPDIVPDRNGVIGQDGTWHRAYVTLDREGASGTYALALTIDGMPVDNRTGFDFGTPQTAELRIGILFTSTAAGTMDLYVDNIIVRGSK
jgi:hypothetical protein